MVRIIIVEPDPRVRDSVQARHLALGAALRITGDMAQAQELVAAVPRALVIARNHGGPEAAAAAACGFDLSRGPAFVRLVLASTPAAPLFIHEVERLVAELSLPFEARRADGLPGLPAEFPHASYVAVSRAGRARCADLLLVRNRITGAKEWLVQVEEEPGAAEDVEAAIYRNFRQRAAVTSGLLRHELTRNHSYVGAGPLPLDFARAVDTPVAALKNAA